MKLPAFISSLKNFLNNTVKKGSNAALREFENTILQALRDHSPVDTGNFASRWKVKKSRFSAPGVMGGVTMYNDTEYYGQFIEAGAPLASAPWWYPHVVKKTGTMARDKKTGQMKKWSGTGKLKIEDGRVWPGGLNPGHNKTVGGAMHIVANDAKLLHKLTVELSDRVIKGWVS